MTNHGYVYKNRAKELEKKLDPRLVETIKRVVKERQDLIEYLKDK